MVFNIFVCVPLFLLLSDADQNAPRYWLH